MSYRAETQAEDGAFFLSISGDTGEGFTLKMTPSARRKLALALTYVSPDDDDDAGEEIHLGACDLTLNHCKA